MFAKIKNLFRKLFGIGKYRTIKSSKEIEKPINNLIRVQLKHYSTTAELIKRNAKTLIVRLPDGHIIKRHQRKHVIGAEG